MAAQRHRAVTLTEFRVMVVVALIAHAIVLFALPRLQFLFSPDVMELMRYGGHGARVAMSHPIIFALYLLPFPAFLGMYLMQAWGRHLLLAYVALTVIGSFFFGTSISGPPETFFAEIATLVDGALLGFAYFSPPCTRAQPSNTTPHTDARDVPAPASGSAARAGGRER